MILLPAISIARQKTQSERCLNNLHQLTTAWLMYASANGDRCVNNFGLANAVAAANSKTYNTWCLDVMDWTANSQNTNLNLLRVGQLAPYTGGNTAHFDCPANVYLSPGQVAAGFKSRVRSYSMNAFFRLLLTCK